MDFVRILVRMGAKVNVEAVKAVVAMIVLVLAQTLAKGHVEEGAKLIAKCFVKTNANKVV